LLVELFESQPKHLADRVGKQAEDADEEAVYRELEEILMDMQDDDDDAEAGKMVFDDEGF